MSTPKLQAVFAEFTDTVAELIEDEFSGNGQLLSAYVSYPHGAQSKSMSPFRANVHSIANLIPERAPTNYAKQTVFKKARENIQKMEADNQLRKEKEIEEAVRKAEKEERKEQLRRGLWEELAAIGKRKNEEKEKIKAKEKRKLMMPVQQEMCDRVERIMDQIDDLDINNT